MSSYNVDLDKITEREVVYDFVERLKIGKNLDMVYNDENVNIFKPKTLLINIIKYILGSLPPSIIINNNKLTRKIIDIPAGTKVVTINVSGKNTMYRAYSDKTYINVSSAFVATYNKTTNITTLRMTCDSEYPYDDILTLHIKSM